jgi:hypothetical protein
MTLALQCLLGYFVLLLLFGVPAICLCIAAANGDGRRGHVGGPK